MTVHYVGILPSGRGLYRKVFPGAAGYCAADELVTSENWGDYAWWTAETEWVQLWLRTVKKEAGSATNPL